MKNNICIQNKKNSLAIPQCKETITNFEHSFEILSNALQLAGNKVRLKILFLLNENKNLCVCDLSDILDMNISAISQHLRKLKDRKIIVATRNAQTIYYSITEEYKNIFFPFFELITEKETLKSVS